MPSNGATSTETPGLDGSTAEVLDLDSPEVTNNFLSAISFAAAVKGSQQTQTRTRPDPKSGPATPAWSRPSVSQWTAAKTPPKPVTNAQGAANKTTDNSPCPGSYYQKAPGHQTWGLKKTYAAVTGQSEARNGRGGPNSSRGRKASLSTSTAAPESQIWGTKQSHTAVTVQSQARNGTSEVDTAQGRKAPPAKKPTPTSTLTKQSPKPINCPTSQTQPSELDHTARPSFSQSFVPAEPGTTATAPEAQEHKLSAAEADNTGDEVRNSEMGHQERRVSGSINRYSPDLTGYPMPLPNKSYPGSWPSTPSSISTINISETGLGEASPKPDIRNTIAMQNDINKSGNTWFMQDWNHVKGDYKDEALRCEKYIETFIDHWADAIPNNVQASFCQESGTDHWKCDFNTNTGSLLPPVNYPDTLVDLSRVDKSIEWQRLNWTATLLMERTKSRHNPGSDDPPSDCRKYAGNVAENYVQRQNELEIVDPKLVKKICDERYQKPEFNEFVPRIPCFLRPAEKYDMEAVQRIYNWEVEHGLQALDSHPVPVESFEEILSTAQKLEMPFIVAVRGSARKLGLTKGNLLWSPYRQRPTDELDPQGRRRGELLGFAFLSVWEPGVGGGLGSGLGTSRATAKINVCVHPDYRKKKIGFSLVDMLLTTASDRYSSQSGFDFVDPDNMPVYKSPARHSRQYFRLYFHYLVKHQHMVENNKKLEQEQKEYDNDLVWVRKMFDEQLGFTELVRFEAAHRSAKGRDGPVYWLDQVVFEHACYFAPSFIKDDY